MTRPLPNRARALRVFDSPIVHGALLILISLVVYLPVIRGGWVWDDDVLITANPLVRSVGGLPGIWRGEINPDYFPLTSTLFWLEARAWGINPLGFHLVNCLLHGGAVILAWRVLARVGAPLPWLAALLFAVHPVSAGTVAWIAEGKNTLSMLLMLAGMLEYLRWRDTGSTQWLPYTAALVWYLLALLSKTSAVTLPLVLLLCDWWRGRSFSRRDVLLLLPWIALSGLFGAITILFQRARAIGGAEVQIGGPYARLCAAGKALWFYAIKVLAPIHLGIIYPQWTSHRVPGWDALPALLILLAFAAAWRWRRTRWGRGFLFGAGCYVLLLVPVLGLVKMYYLVFAPVADHLQYVAMPALIALAVGAVSDLARSAGVAWVAPWALGATAALFGTLAALHCAVYKDQASLWQFAVEENPSSFEAQNGYALVLAEEGRLDDAVGHFREAIRLKPSFLKSWLNLGSVLYREHRLDEAIQAYREAVQVEPRFADSHFALGNLLLEKGSLLDAANEYEEVIRLNPNNSDAHQNLGVILQRAGRIDDAINEYRTASQLSPDDPMKHSCLGIALFQQGRAAEAAEQFAALAALVPADPSTHNNYGAALLDCGRPADAARQFRIAIQIDPSFAAARENLEKALASIPPSNAK